jgi:alpha-1,3-glucosyltransferase
MLVLVPYTFLAAEDYAHFRTFTLLSTAGIVSLFPLLYEPGETLIKIVYSLIWAIIVFGTLQQRVYRPVASNLGLLVHGLETLYIWVFLALQVYVSVLHPVLFPVLAPSTVLSGQFTSMETSSHNAVTTGAMPGVVAAISGSASCCNGSACSYSGHTADNQARLSIPTCPNEMDRDVAYLPPGEIKEAMDERTFVLVKAISTSEFDRFSAQSSAANWTSGTHYSPQNAAKNEGAVDGRKAPLPATVPLASSMEFLPLMLVSVYCSIGVVWCWLRASAIYLTKRS